MIAMIEVTFDLPDGNQNYALVRAGIDVESVEHRICTVRWFQPYAALVADGEQNWRKATEQEAAAIYCQLTNDVVAEAYHFQGETAYESLVRDQWWSLCDWQHKASVLCK